MIIYCRFLVAIGFSLLMSLALASTSLPKEGVDYLTLKNPQPTSAGNKVEVIEFFGYFCSHCYSLDIVLADWAQKQRNNVHFKRVHIRFGEGMVLQQHLFYTLSTMGQLSDSLHHKIFESFHLLRTPLRTEQQMVNFVKNNGISPDAFTEMFRSPSIRSLSDEATKLQADYKINYVPILVVDGRFTTSLATVSEGNPSIRTAKEAQARTLFVLDHLIKRILNERKSGRTTRSVVEIR